MERIQLENLLSETISVEGRNIIIWGTGNTAELYQEGIRRLLQEKKLNIVGYGDNNIEKQGSMYYGKMVYSAEQIAKMDNVQVLILSPTREISDAVSKQLNDLSIENYIFDNVIFRLYKDEVLQVYDLMDNAGAKELYAALVKCRMFNEEVTEEMYSGDSYFAVPACGKRNPKEVFVDCGSYVGDTVEQYLWKREGAFKKIIAFEPDVKNYNAMVRRCERLKTEWNIAESDIELYPYGIGEQDNITYVSSYDDNHGLGSKLSVDNVSDNVTETKIVSIDSFIKEPIHFIKADIESYEYGMIKGSQKTLQNCKPKLAICIYHNVMDFFQIPLLIHEINDEYKISIRHHSYELADTVLYAW